MSPKVLLIYPYHRTRARTETLLPPLGVCSLKAQLRIRGIESLVVDGTFLELPQIGAALAAHRPSIVGVYSMVTLSRASFRVAEAARALLPGAILVAGGPLPTLYPERYSPQFDVVIRGEADLSFPRFCRDALGLGIDRSRIAELPLDRYAGLTVPPLGVAVPPVHHAEAELQLFPPPDRSDLDHAAYQAAWSAADGTRTTSIMTTLGCPFSCDFCSRPVFGNAFRRRGLDVVMEEIDGIRAGGYDSLWIADDCLTLDHGYLADFCGRVASRGMRWSCLSRVTGLDRSVARMMREAGCRRVYLGLESGSQATLRLMNKRATVEDGASGVQLLHEAGIEVAAFFIVGYPGETLSSIDETFRFALSLPLVDLSFNVPYPLPGAPLYDRVKGLDRDGDWDTENEVTFLYESEFDERWLRRRIDETMRRFARSRRGSLAAFPRDGSQARRSRERLRGSRRR